MGDRGSVTGGRRHESSDLPAPFLRWPFRELLVFSCRKGKGPELGGRRGRKGEPVVRELLTAQLRRCQQSGRSSALGPQPLPRMIPGSAPALTPFAEQAGERVW